MTPIIAPLGSKFATIVGNEPNKAKGPFPATRDGLTFNKTGNCLAMMMIPIATVGYARVEPVELECITMKTG